MTNKFQNNIVVSIVLIAILIVGGYFLISKTNKNETPEISFAWKTFSDTKNGVTFGYPEKLSTKYIKTVDWPPKVQVIEGPFVCTDAGEEEERAGKTEEKIINGRGYCVTTVSEGAAGSTYTQYAYAAKFEGKTLYFTFALRFPQCANYDDPKKTECDNERTAFNIDSLIDQIIQTVKLSEEGNSQINYFNSSADLIVVDLPFGGAVTGKEFSVIGKARGAWFFEASFPIDVLDKNGKVLVATHAEAQGDWMTENFVPFKANIKVPSSYTGPATLVLRKDNPSGLPEHDASISFPITIQY